MRTHLLLAIAFSGIHSLAGAQQLEWATPYIGGSNSLAYGFSNCVEPSGEHVFSAGEFSGTINFDPGASNYSITSPSPSWYLTKTSDAGEFVWARVFEIPYGFDIATDAAGNSYLSGLFTNTLDADPGTGVTQLTTGGADNANFLIKLNPAGELVWAQCIGGNNFGSGAIAIRSNALYYTGVFTGQIDFDNGPGVHELTASDYGDIFVLKMTTDGEFQWVESFGATNNSSQYREYPTDIAIGSTGDVFLTGTFTKPGDFNPQAGISLLVPQNEQDAFLMKLDDQGEFQWALRSGNQTNNAGVRLAAGPDGSVYQVGATNYWDTDTGTNDDFFVARYSSLGTEMWWYQIGGQSTEQGIGMTVDAAGSLYVSGDHSSLNVDFDPGPGEVLLNSDYSMKSYLMKFNPAGELAWAKSFGGNINSMWSLDYSNGKLYCAGYFFQSFDADPGAGTHNLNGGDTYASGFIMKLDTTELIDVTGIGETAFAAFGIYPNPADESTTLQTASFVSGSIITLYDLAGAVVLQQELQAADTQIDLSELLSGVYLVEVQQNGTKSVQRLVKK